MVARKMARSKKNPSRTKWAISGRVASPPPFTHGDVIKNDVNFNFLCNLFKFRFCDSNTDMARGVFPSFFKNIAAAFFHLYSFN